MSKLGFGFMRLPVTDPSNAIVDIELLRQMVDLYMARGNNYFHIPKSIGCSCSSTMPTGTMRVYNPAVAMRSA